MNVPKVDMRQIALPTVTQVLPRETPKLNDHLDLDAI